MSLFGPFLNKVSLRRDGWLNGIIFSEMGPKWINSRIFSTVLYLINIYFPSLILGMKRKKITENSLVQNCGSAKLYNNAGNDIVLFMAGRV